jgi:hypothetical protein
MKDAETAAYLAAKNAPKKLIQAHLEVDFGGSVFVQSQLGADPNGQIRLPSLTELTGTHEQAPGQMLVVTEQIVNALQEQHPDMTVDEAMNHCPIEWGGKEYGSLREFLGLMEGQGLEIEGYSRFGRRFPMSKLGKMTLQQLGLSGLAFKIFDPVSINRIHPNTLSQNYLNGLNRPRSINPDILNNFIFLGHNGIFLENGRQIIPVGQGDPEGRIGCHRASAVELLHLRINDGIDITNQVQLLIDSILLNLDLIQNWHTESETTTAQIPNFLLQFRSSQNKNALLQEIIKSNPQLFYDTFLAPELEDIFFGLDPDAHEDSADVYQIFESSIIPTNQQEWQYYVGVGDTLQNSIQALDAVNSIPCIIRLRGGDQNNLGFDGISRDGTEFNLVLLASCVDSSNSAWCLVSDPNGLTSDEIQGQYVWVKRDYLALHLKGII